MMNVLIYGYLGKMGQAVVKAIDDRWDGRNENKPRVSTRFLVFNGNAYDDDCFIAHLAL